MPRYVIPTGDTFHVKAKSLLELKVGQWYIGARCRSCEQFIATFDDKSQGRMPYNEVLEGEGRINIPCPHCGAEHDYVPSQLQQRQL